MEDHYSKSYVIMIILCIVMTNPGVFVTDAFQKIFPVVLQSKGYKEAVRYKSDCSFVLC